MDLMDLMDLMDRMDRVDRMDLVDAAADDESPGAFDAKLADVSERSNAILERYGVSADDSGVGGGGGMSAEDMDFGDFGDHDEL